MVNLEEIMERFLVFGGLIYVVASKQRKTAKKDMLYQHREREREEGKQVC